MDLRNLNLAELDKNLSEEERREWNSIYASYRAGSLLTGTVSGMETRTVDVKNEETGEYERWLNHLDLDALIEEEAAYMRQYGSKERPPFFKKLGE